MPNSLFMRRPARKARRWRCRYEKRKMCRLILAQAHTVRQKCDTMRHFLTAAPPLATGGPDALAGTVACPADRAEASTAGQRVALTVCRHQTRGDADGELL